MRRVAFASMPCKLQHFLAGAGSPGSIARCDSNSISPVPAHDRPLPLSQSLLEHSSSQPAVLQTGSPLFCVDLFENLYLHGLVGHQTLKPRVLFFQCSQPLGLADFHPSELSLPRMVSGRTDVMRRTDAFTGLPASASRNIPMICSSLNRLLFMFCSFSQAELQLCHVPLLGFRP